MNDILNPYIAGAPVVEASMFFGREDVFSWIERSLAGKFVDHILVLHGQRRVGKTSVLKQIPNFLPKHYIQVFFDLQGRTSTSLDRFLWWLASEIARTLKKEREINIPRPDRKAFEDTEILINEFLPGLRSLLGDQVLLLTFDEFDTLDRPEIQESLALPLIAYLRRLMEMEGLNFVFSIGSSGDKLENMQASYTDFFKTALYRKISFLTRDDCQRLITKPVEGTIQYERKAVDRIVEITSGHPYFTQLMCHELFALCQKTGARNISAADVESVLGDVIERGTVNLKFVWDEASDLEKWILAGLAQMDGGAPLDRGATTQKLSQLLQKQRVRFSESDLNSAVIHLRDKDIITQDNRFIIHLMRMWLQANRPLDRVREELVEVNPIANRYIEIGDEYRDRGQAAQAIESYEQALRADPGNLKAQASIGTVHLERRAYPQAAAAFELALRIDDEDVAARTGFCDANLALGDGVRREGEIETAIGFYEKILLINPAHADARRRLADIYRRRAEDSLSAGQEDAALSAFNRAMDYVPEDDTLAARYDAVLAQKKAKVVAEWLGKAERSLARQRWDEAAGFAEEALKLDPENPDLQARLAAVKDAPRQFKLQGYKREAEQAIRRGSFEKAISAIETAILLAPEDKSLAEWLESARSDQLNAQLNLYREQARKAISAGDWEAAIAARKEALKLSPADPALQKELADTEKARLQAQLSALKSQAEAAIRSGDWDGAIGAYKQAAKLVPDDPTWQEKVEQTATARLQAQSDAFQKQADEAIAQGDWETAIQAVKNAAKIAPDAAPWKEKLAEIETARHQAASKALRQEADAAYAAGNWDAAIAALEKYAKLEPNQMGVQAEIEAIQAEKRQRQLIEFKAQAEKAAKAENWAEAVAAWENYLALEPEDGAKIETTLQHARKYAKISGNYTEAQEAIRRKRYGRAIELLQTIIAQDPTYKSTSRLLVEAVEANKAIPLWRRPWALPALGAVVVIVVGVIFGPRLWDGISTALQRTPVPTESLAVEEESAPEAQVSPTEAAVTEGEESTAPTDISTSTGKTYTVTSTESSGAGTLRQALWDARAGDTITFDPVVFPPTHPMTITLESGLPAISQGYLTLDASNAGVILDGSNAGEIWTPGILIDSEYNVIKGLQVVHFTGPGILLVAEARFNIIGGDRTIGLGPLGEGNLLSGNSDGVAIRGSDNLITGNLIGTNITGSGKMGNESPGIFLEGDASRNTIGPDNLIAYNGTPGGGCGVEFRNLKAVSNTITANVIFGNNFGQDKSQPSGICYNIGEAAPFTLSTPPTLLEVNPTTGIVNGQTCPNCIVEIFSTNTQDGEIYEGSTTADSSGNFSFDKGGPLSGPFLTATTRTSGGNTSEFSLAIPALKKPALYEFVQLESTWYEARDYCAERGGYLVSIRSSVENDYIEKLTGGYSWLGASDEAKEGTWIWLNGEPWEYTHWAQTQPDNYLEEEHYLGMGIWGSDPSRWNDAPETDRIPFVCEWDSLDQKSGLNPAIQTALDTTQAEEPTYQTNFDSWEFGDPVGNAGVENGKLIITSENMEDIPSANVSNFGSDRFALEYDFRILDFVLTESICGSGFVNDFGVGEESWRQFFTSFSANGKAILGYYEYPDQFPILADIQTDFDFSETNTFTLIVLSDQIAAFLNGQFIYTVQNPVGSAIYTQQHLSAAGQNACEFDNYKYWDLSEVDFSAETLEPAASFYEPILAYLDSTNSTFEDDFSTSKTEWGRNSYYSSVAGMRKDDALRVANDEDDLTFPTNGLLDAADFAVAFDFVPEKVGDPGIGRLGLRFRASETSGAYYYFYLSYSKHAIADSWLFTESDGTDVRTTEMKAVRLYDDNNHILIFARGGYLAIFVNDKILYEKFDLASWGDENFFIKSGPGGSIAYLDNFQFWNLEGVDF